MYPLDYTKTLRIIVIKEQDKILTKFVLAILNSSLINFYYSFIGRRKGDVLEYFVEPLKKIPIQTVSLNLQKPYVDLIDKIISLMNNDDYLTNSSKQRKINECERQIDDMVYGLYGLTPEEIAIVEGKRDN